MAWGADSPAGTAARRILANELRTSHQCHTLGRVHHPVLDAVIRRRTGSRQAALAGHSGARHAPSIGPHYAGWFGLTALGRGLAEAGTSKFCVVASLGRSTLV